MCKAPGAASRDDCVAVGRLLFHDRSASIIARMVGGMMLRRLVKGSPEDVAARKLRRDYVWGELQLTEKHASYQDQFQSEIESFGEWEAWERALERLGISREPPAGWAPDDPNLLLLSEERAPAPTR